MNTPRIGIREFRAGLSDYIASDTPVAVTRHGQTVGYFIPTQGAAEAELAALRKATAKLDRLLAASQVDEDEVASEFKAARRVARASATPTKSATRRTKRTSA